MNLWKAVLITMLLALGVVGWFAGAHDASAQAAQSVVPLAPHRAVYDITLVRAATGSGIAEMSGRMVYELSGSTCDGYTQNMRFVTRITDREGNAQVNDLRSSTWEDGAGERLRFHLSQYRNQRLTDTTEGDAGRSHARGPVDVKLRKPKRKGLRLKPEVYFPIQHSIALIAAAKAGKRLMSADVYDGSEKGEKVYLTSAYIGKRVSSGTRLFPEGVEVPAGLGKLQAWPVSISYFEPGGAHTDAVPAYELSFRFIENGISSRLLIDYGDFAIRGELRELRLLDRAKCAAGSDQK